MSKAASILVIPVRFTAKSTLAAVLVVVAARVAQLAPEPLNAYSGLDTVPPTTVAF